MLTLKKNYDKWTRRYFCGLFVSALFALVFAPNVAKADSWDIVNSIGSLNTSNPGTVIFFGTTFDLTWPQIQMTGTPKTIAVWIGALLHAGDGISELTLRDPTNTIVCTSGSVFNVAITPNAWNTFSFSSCPSISNGSTFPTYTLSWSRPSSGDYPYWDISNWPSSSYDGSSVGLLISSGNNPPPAGIPPFVNTTTRIVSFQVLQTSPFIKLYSHLYYSPSSTMLDYIVRGFSITYGKFYDGFFIHATTTGDWYDTQEFYAPTQATSTMDFDSITLTGAILQNAIATTTFMTVDSTSTVLFLGTGGQPPNIPNFIATSTCSIFSGEGILGCIRNAIVWAVYPTQSVLDLYNGNGGLADQLTSKSPVGYFVLVKNSILGFSTSSAPLFFFRIPDAIQTSIFTPLKVALASFLWIFFLIHFFKRLKELHLW